MNKTTTINDERLMLKFILIAMWLGVLAGCAKGAAPPDSPPASPSSETAWPLSIQSSAARIEIYQPQPESLTGDKLDARAAVSLLPPGATEPMFGAMWMSARISTDRDERTVTIRQVDVKNVRFPDAAPAQQAQQNQQNQQKEQQQEQQFAQVLKEQLPRLNVTFALDELMPSLQLAQREKVETTQLQNNPPHIIFSSEPATLITIDGAPRLQPIEQSNARRVVNTPFILLRDTDTNRYFLKTGDSWASAQDINGPWDDSVAPPANISAAAAKLAPPPQPNATPAAAAAPAPAPQPVAPGRIIVATEPTELIVTNGQPVYSPVHGADLLYVTNTQSDVFLDGPTQQTYVLFSGRWFRSKSLQGPWEHVAADKLPPAFASIPADSPKADVLSFIAGTAEANDAVLDASIPQTTSIRRDAGASVKVAYDGDPNFQPIQGTALTYATNTANPVVRQANTYYCCQNGVWYQSLSPNGPWSVCTSVPEEIYTIPPSSPIYSSTYVHVYDYDADSVLCGYLPGYTGSYVDGPTVVYGTGYAYPGWYGSYYIPRPWTYGFGAYYDPGYAMWDFGVGYPYGPPWFAYDPFYFGFGWFGAGGFRHRFHDFRGEDGRRFGYGRDFHGDGVNIYHRGANMGRNFDRPGAGNRFNVRGDGGHNNVFAGRDGRVYRSTGSGWEQHDGHAWNRMNAAPEARQAAERMPAEHGFSPAPIRGGGLEADQFARERGAARANAFRGGGGGGFHGGGGGGFRGGGGGGFRGGGGGGFHGGGGGGHR
ncbi:MAG: hypothetical protein QOE14_2485 [Humisphaera sp.]|nr:hypothetical protein [Humisphaera sp.]